MRINLLFVVLFLLASCQQVPEEKAFLNATFYDVGQGSSTLLEFHNKTVLHDCGPEKAGLSTKLLADDLTNIDLLVVSHMDSDHLGGCASVINDLVVRRVADNGDVKKTSVFSDYVKAREGVEEYDLIKGDSEDHVIDGLYYIVAYDLSDQDQGNDRSILLSLPELILLTGDCGFDCESELITTAKLDSSIIQVGHHGSASSTTADFLEEVSPSIAVVPVGRNNYGHPDSEVLDRLDDRGVIVFRTDRDGDVRIESGLRGISVASENGGSAWVSR